MHQNGLGRGIFMGGVGKSFTDDARKGLSERLRAYINRSSIKTAFMIYSIAAVMAAALLSFFVAGVTSTLYADSTAQQSRYSGAYLYDPQENMLLPAVSFPWYVDIDYAAGAKREEGIPDEGADAESAQDAVPSLTLSSNPMPVYFERVDADPEFYPSIDLDDLPAGIEIMSIADMDFDQGFADDDLGVAPTGPNPESLSFGEIAEYDAAANAARGDIDALRSALESSRPNKMPHISYVGYYVYLGEGTWADVYIWMTVLAVPAACVLCFALAARRFYRTKLQRPIESMGEAVRRVADGDLDFSLEVEDGGELGDLGRSFEAMRSELSKANRAMWHAAENRRRASTAFAHDLRTPLTVLSGRAEMLAEFAPSGAIDADQVVEVARAMQRQTARLTAFVESMRDLDALESFVPNPTETDVSEWFQQEGEDACELARGKGLDCVVSGPDVGIKADIDVHATARIVQNLVGNAIRHANSVVRLSCTASGNTLELCVDDDGPGFSEDALSHAIEPYWREKEPNGSEEADGRNASHFGLGLNISAVLCDKLDGTLFLSNNQDGGGHVVVSLPLAHHAGR